ncbi:hypothetical protein BJY00DRAFT_314066 [Aspergillus carlsbadensis]|nr:hypothetical protein BJY00DRAFT_314066 [Aspergillus carlsbadensis]
MCFEWTLDHIPFFLPEWIRQKIEAIVLEVAFWYYTLCMSIICIIVIYVACLVYFPVVGGALLTPLVVEFWDTIGGPVYVEVARMVLWVHRAVERYVPRVFLWPIILGWRWCCFWWWIVTLWFRLWMIVVFYFLELINCFLYA